MNYLVGLDLGQASDYTALAILERIEPGRAPLTGYSELDNDRPPAGVVRYHGRHLERFKLGTPYPAVATRVAEIMGNDALRGRSRLVVDNTGVGRPVVDMIRQSGLAAVPITITGGDAVSRDGQGFRVPNRDLVGVVQVLLQTERLRFAARMPEVPTLLKELQDLRVKISADTAHDSYGSWREGSHDDLVLAVAVAVWYGERGSTRPWAWVI